MYRNDLIRAAIVNKDLNKKSFKEQSGLSQPSVDKLWDGEENIELPTLKRAADFLEIPMHDLFQPREETATVGS